ncbi:MAG: exodeoxyribonuclease VII small subunit [Planctomycetota bacterium]|jgi:exodeoxyribonuclease VII small subunit
MAKKKQPSFAEARDRLEQILAEVESDEGDVDQLADRVKEASELIRLCRDRLSAARQQVEKVVADLEAVERSVAEDDDAKAEAEEDDEGRATEGSSAGSLPF